MTLGLVLKIICSHQSEYLHWSQLTLSLIEYLQCNESGDILPQVSQEDHCFVFICLDSTRLYLGDSFWCEIERGIEFLLFHPLPFTLLSNIHLKKPNCSTRIRPE